MRNCQLMEKSNLKIIFELKKQRDEANQQEEDHTVYMYLGEDNQYYTEAQIAEQRAVTNHSSISREQNSIYDQFNLQSR